MTPTALPAKLKGTAFTVFSAFLITTALVLAACGSGSANKSSGPKVLTAVGDVSGSYTQNMSPFSPNVNVGVKGLIYEPLVYVNKINAQTTPMLAQSQQYSSDNKSLTLTLRQGVKWSDGQAFSASDVVFTFNLLKQYPGADGNGLWQHLASVTNSDANTVVLTFNDVDTALLPYIDGLYVVPQHIWSSVGDPTKYINATPVGTGPFTLKTFTAQQISYKKNPSYWQAGQVKVDEVDYPTVSSNDTAVLKLSSHQADWSGVFSASLKSAFQSKDTAHNFIYMVPVVPSMLLTNQTDPLLSQLPVRKAISQALNRSQMGISGESGLQQPASPTGLMPGQEKYLDAKYSGTLPAFKDNDPAGADQTLEAAGFKKGGDGIYADPSGKKLNFTVTVPADYSDYVQDLQIAQQNLQAAGIGLTLNKVTDDDFHTDRASGKFQLLMSGGFYGAGPYYYLQPLLDSTAIGGANATDWEQWKDPTTDQLLHAYATTSDTTAQTQSITKLTNIMADQLPVIPLLDATEFFEYTTVNWTGWPTPQNPYAIGSAYSLPAGDNEQVILHLTPAS